MYSLDTDLTKSAHSQTHYTDLVLASLKPRLLHSQLFFRFELDFFGGFQRLWFLYSLHYLFIKKTKEYNLCFSWSWMPRKCNVYLSMWYVSIFVFSDESGPAAMQHGNGAKESSQTPFSSHCSLKLTLLLLSYYTYITSSL